ncbi:MAG: hypothetical protein K1X35_14095, partial [Caulobacteraceae bacterium]|nr:hypothetical protein [Caulobacteraceae bacterium]
MSGVGEILFQWIATAWLHGLCLFALVWIAVRLGLRRAPALEQTAWRVVLTAPLLSAALQVFALQGGLAPVRLERTEPVAATVKAALAARAPAASDLAPPAPPLSSVLGRNALPAIGFAWLGLLGVASLRAGWQRLALLAYRRRLVAARDAELLADARAVGEAAGLSRMGLFEDPRLPTPVAVPPDAVVLPRWIEALTRPQRTALLAHEAWHLKRRDPEMRAGFGALALVTLAPHGPQVLRRLDELAEQACDAWAAGFAGDGQPLAECLAACLERGLEGPIPSGVAAMARRPSPVVERVRRLLENPPMKPTTRPFVQYALAAALLGSAALAAPGLALGRPVPDAAAEARTAEADARQAEADARTAAADAATFAADASAAAADDAAAAA